MMKILRSLRQNVIANGKLKQYLLYTLGEILLVMIGILLALRVNEWNDNRKDQALEQTYYCKLTEDIQQDVLQIDKMIEENNDRIHQCNLLIHLLQTGKPNPYELSNAVVGSISKTTFTFKTSTAAFEDLKSSGNLKILRDHAIKDSLIHYYATLEGYIDVIDINSDYTVALYYDPSKDFIAYGWQYMAHTRAVVDSSLVNQQALDVHPFPSPGIRKQLLSDAIFYMTTNGRKAQWYNIMKAEIMRMLIMMNQKCL
ncbi:MAG: DUF6090 family protein [Saprospiraceae bacterium]